MKKKNDFLPVLLGSDSNVYGMARSFYEEYKIKSVALGKKDLVFTRNSKIVTVNTHSDLEENFVEILNAFASENKDKYKKFVLVSCSDGYTELIIKNRKKLDKSFVFSYVSELWKKRLEDKEDFYAICEKYDLDYPETYICEYKNKNIIKLPFDFPVALKPSDSILYAKIYFEGKEKSYKINDKRELERTINKIYNSGYKGNLIIQDFIPGGEENMFVLNSYSNKDGKVAMMCLGDIALEEYDPLNIGNYQAIISSTNEDLYKKMQTFLEKIKYVGFSNIDLKYDPRDNKFKLFEINIRQGRSSFYVTSASNNMAKYLVDDLIKNKSRKTVYSKNEFLWSIVPKRLLKSYFKNSVYKDKIEKLLKNKKVTYTLFPKYDRGLKRRLTVLNIYRVFYKNYFKFFKKSK